MKTATTIILLLFSLTAYASGDRITQSNDNNSQTTGDVNVEAGDLISGNGDAYGIGIPGLGDVDIAGCLGSEQWTLLIGGKQKLVLNWPCMAEFYLRNDKPQLAAMALCNTEIVEEFADEQECEAAHDFLAEMPAAQTLDLSPIFERLDALEARIEQEVEVAEDEHEEQQVVVQQLNRQVASLRRTVQEFEEAPPPEPQVVYVDEGAERRARARAARQAAMEEASGNDQE